LKYLANLKDERENGDYDIFSYTDKDMAATAIAEAREFLKESKSYLKRIGLID